MSRFLLAILIAIASTCPCWATTKADAAYGVRYTQERVFELPQDQAKLYLTVFIGRDRPEVAQWFDTHPTLAEIRNRCHFNVVPQSSVMFERYASTTPRSTTVRLQRADGSLIDELSGTQIPFTADSLAARLNRQATECFVRPWRNRPNVQPNVDPAPQPLPAPLPPPKPTPKNDRLPWILLGILAAVGGTLGLVREYKRLYPKK